MTLINVDIYARLHPLRKIKKISFTLEHRINKLLVRSTSVRLYLIIFPQANKVDPDLVPYMSLRVNKTLGVGAIMTQLKT